jgi:hypothetical protein
VSALSQTARSLCRTLLIWVDHLMCRWPWLFMRFSGCTHRPLHLPGERIRRWR